MLEGAKMLDANHIVRLQDQATVRWHEPASISVGESQEAGADFEALVLAQHRANFDLWHQEDEARDPLAADARIADIKHEIDKLNQQRNDLVERIDNALLAAAGAQAELAPLHSETPGMMIDRLSILALKIFHTAEEVERTGTTFGHRERNRERLSRLLAQRDDLSGCLAALWAEVHAGRRRFKLYRQMKMYNDPELNPVLYGRNHAAIESAGSGDQEATAGQHNATAAFASDKET